MAKKFVTAALPYVNNQPHLGNIVGCVLGADIYSRFSRKMGDECIYICGTDEYGTATEMEAMKQKIHPREIVEKNRVIHKKIYDWLDLSFDIFGHTDCKEHSKLTQEIFMRCYENGYFEETDVEQFFCTSCDQYLADRYVEGVCKLCGYENARGDQCDKCGKCLKIEDLEHPECTLCRKCPEMRRTKHLYLRLDILQDKIKSHFETKKNRWTDNAKAIYEEWMKKEIHSRCMTRALKYKWGVPVPLEGFEDKVFYVWFDAPIGYFTFLSQKKEDWKQWAKDAKFIQFMGKDNVPFHSIIFPAMILAANERNGFSKKENKLNGSKGDTDNLKRGESSLGGDNEPLNNSIKVNTDNLKRGESSLGDDNEPLNTGIKVNADDLNDNNDSLSLGNLNLNNSSEDNYPIVDIINSTEYLTFNGEKFSKSRNFGIFGLDLLENDLGAPSLWRYYLTKKRPESKDGDFCTEEFISLVNGDLISNLGNLCNRVLSYINKRLSGALKLEVLDDFDKAFIDDVNSLFSSYKSHMEAIQLRDGIGKAFEISSRGNKYLQDLQANKSRQSHGFSLCYSLIVFLGHIFEPFIPEVSKSMFEMTMQKNNLMPNSFEIINNGVISSQIRLLFTPLTEIQLENIRKFASKK